MLLKEFTQKQQSELASYCRTNELADDLQVRKERVHHYRRLVFNVINDSLQSAFPLALNLIGENEWTQLAHHFFLTINPNHRKFGKCPVNFVTGFLKLNNLFAINFRL
ncbi:MAG: putative DNA-binding domain-containing protein [Bacteroidales bacterium]